jgi:hypothetical protein
MSGPVGRAIFNQTFATGIEDNQATRLWWSKSRTITSGNTEDIDLYDFALQDEGAGLGRDGIGQLLFLKQVVGWIVKQTGGTGRLEINPTNPANYATWIPSLTVATGGALKADGAVTLLQPKQSAMRITDGSSHIVRFGANGGDIVYNIYLIGRHYGN